MNYRRVALDLGEQTFCIRLGLHGPLQPLGCGQYVSGQVRPLQRWSAWHPLEPHSGRKE
jgi:hypothetical protein